MSDAESRFARLANLAFYDGFNSHYVYFKSLNGKMYNDKNEDYTRARIKAQFDAIQGNRNFMNSEATKKSFLQDSNYEKKFNACLKLVREGIQYESKNEIAYFKQQLEAFEKTFSDEDIKANPEVAKIHNFLKTSCTKEGIIDYEEFLALVNGLLSGFKNAHSIASYEKNRITKISNAIDAISKKREQQLHGLATTTKMSLDQETKMIERSLKHLNNRINTYYIENKSYDKQYDKNSKVKDSLRGAVRAFQNVHQAADNEVAAWIRKQMQNIFNNSNVMTEISKYLQNAGYVKIATDYTDAANVIKGIIVNAIAAHAAEHIPEIINKKYRNIPKQKIVKILEDSIEVYQSYRIDGFYNNWSLTGKHLKAFKEMEEGFDLHNQSAEEFMEMFGRLRRVQESPKGVLSKERSELYNFLHGKGIYKEFSNLISIIKMLQKADRAMSAAQSKIARGKQMLTETKEFQLGKNEKGETVTLTLKITPKQVKLVDNLDDSIRSLETIKTIFGDDKQLTFTTLKNSIANLNRQASPALRDRIADAVDAAVALASTEDQSSMKKSLYKMISDGLQNLHVSVRGPNVAELMSAINFESNDRYKVSVNLSGWTQIKNDVIVVSLDYKDVKLSVPIQQILDNKDKQMTELIAEHASSEEMAHTLQAKVISTFQEDVAKEFAKHTTLQDKRYTANAASFINKYQAFSERKMEVDKVYERLQPEWDAYAREITDRGESKEYFEQKYQDYLHALEKSFYISTTVKSYDYYNDSIGFGGGSLGGNLTAQLNNIADIFSLAGMPMTEDEISWLYFIIINTGKATIFEDKYQSRIEQYFGSLAAFMLFDEGGAEVKMLNALSKNLKISYSSPKILHLYRVNGLYVTGSYVLQQIEKELLEYQTIMNDVQVRKNFQSKNHGASIHIINNMNEGMIENRGKKASPTPGKNPWQDIAEKAEKNVRLEIFFLAGLLDIADKLESKLSNIQLPSK